MLQPGNDRKASSKVPGVTQDWKVEDSEFIGDVTATNLLN